MREGATIAVGRFQEGEHLGQPLKRFLAFDPLPLHRDDDRHDTPPGSAKRDEDILTGIPFAAPVARHTAAGCA